jgi:hypothetical protein
MPLHPLWLVIEASKRTSTAGYSARNKCYGSMRHFCSVCEPATFCSHAVFCAALLLVCAGARNQLRSHRGGTAYVAGTTHTAHCVQRTHLTSVCCAASLQVRVLVPDAKGGRIEVAVHVLHALSTFCVQHSFSQPQYGAAAAEGIVRLKR